MRFQYLRPVNTIFLLFFEMQIYKKSLLSRLEIIGPEKARI